MNFYVIFVVITINLNILLMDCKKHHSGHYPTVRNALEKLKLQLDDVTRHGTQLKDVEEQRRKSERYRYLKPNKQDDVKGSNRLIDALKSVIKLRDINDENLDEGRLKYETSLDTDGRYYLSWDISTVEETITFRVEAKINRADVFGFGFSNYGEANKADLFVLWTNKKGRHFATDMYTDSDDVLHIDNHQDYSLEGMNVLDDVITFQFSRKYDTCDDNDYVIDPGTTHIIFFTSPGRVDDIRGKNVTSFNPGLQRVQLLKSELPVSPLPSDTQTFVMHVENVHIPAQETTYWCSVQKLPDMTSKHHIIKFEGHISEASQGIVHHMEVFHCDVPVGTPVRSYNAPCRVYGAERPKGLESCRQVIGAWAMGAPPLSYPDEAGYAVGGQGFSRYIMMEVHYNNPEIKSGIVDSSGIKFYVTEQLRHYDAGIMELGLEYSDKYAIPPGQSLWPLTGYCIPQCTHVGLPGPGINVFASQLHTHLTGKKVFTKHFREGIELPELNRDNHYSPHYQEIRRLHRQVTVLPGDSLVTTCQDSTENKKNVTLGGFSISDEMCVNYIHYYPKVQLEVCKSSVTTQSLYGFFNFLHRYQWEETSSTKGIADNFHSIQWSPMNVELMKNYMQMAPLSMQCNQSDGNRFPGEWENRGIPQIIEPLPEEERPCLT